MRKALEILRGALVLSHAFAKLLEEVHADLVLYKDLAKGGFGGGGSGSSGWGYIFYATRSIHCRHAFAFHSSFVDTLHLILAVCPLCIRTRVSATLTDLQVFCSNFDTFATAYLSSFFCHSNNHLFTFWLFLEGHFHAAEFCGFALVFS